jgi:hypothetical protein
MPQVLAFCHQVVADEHELAAAADRMTARLLSNGPGAMALQSTHSGLRRLTPSACASSPAKSSAAPGFMIESMTSHVSVNFPTDPTSVRPASRASVLLRALRLSSAVHTLIFFASVAAQPPGPCH